MFKALDILYPINLLAVWLKIEILHICVWISHSLKPEVIEGIYKPELCNVLGLNSKTSCVWTCDKKCAFKTFAQIDTLNWLNVFNPNHFVKDCSFVMWKIILYGYFIQGYWKNWQF